jgi:type VI secretion system protein ImpA
MGDDYEGLLESVSPSSPAGTWVRDQDIYRKLSLCRRADDPALPQGIWKQETSRADWPAAAQLAREILRSHAKDLLVAVWLVEANLRLQGFAALGPGLVFLTSLCREFWQDLFPNDADDPEVRNAPLYWINEKLPLAMREIPLFGKNFSYAWSDFETALRHEAVRQSDVDLAIRAERAGRVTIEMFNEAAAAQPVSSLRHLYDALKAAAEGAELFAEELERLEGDRAPSLSTLQQHIGDMLNLVDSWLPPPGISDGPDLAEAAPAEPAERQLPSKIASVDDAYVLLREAADYLLRREPENPVAHIVKRALELAPAAPAGRIPPASPPR